MGDEITVIYTSLKGNVSRAKMRTLGVPKEGFPLAVGSDPGRLLRFQGESPLMRRDGNKCSPALK